MWNETKDFILFTFAKNRVKMSDLWMWNRRKLEFPLIVRHFQLIGLS